MATTREVVIEKREKVGGLKPWQQCIVFVLVCGILVTRRWHALSHQQFYAEDGHVFFADAYNQGWFKPLFSAYAGYLHLFSRIGADLALMLPFSKVPTFFNFISLACAVFPTNILMSSRSVGWGSLRFRALLAVAYVALPNCREVTWGLTNTFNLLALIAVLILVDRTPTTKFGVTFDAVLFGICGLNGPFCIFMVPLACLLFWKDRSLARGVQATILIATTAIQSTYLLFIDSHVRTHHSLGANPFMLLKILGGHIFLATEIGSNTFASVTDPTFSWFLVLIAILCSLLVFDCASSSPQPFKLFLVFSLSVFSASLALPLQLGTPRTGVWQVLATVPGHRYWFFPTICFVWSMIWLVLNRSGLRRTIPASLLTFSVIFGVVRDWKIPHSTENDFAPSISRFQDARPGSLVVLQEGTPGWTMELMKH